MIVCSLSLHAQYSLETYSEEELELLEIIKSDPKLFDYYNSGFNKLKIAKLWGIQSLTYMGFSVVSTTIAFTSDGIAGIIARIFIPFSAALSIITGTKGLLTRRKGKKRIRNAFDAAGGDLRSEYYGGFEIQVNGNGVSLVYSF